MDAEIERALRQDRMIDITTTGRRSGEARRIEIWFHDLDGRIYITGRPGRRGWYANLVANPDFTFHLKQSAQADLPARARPIADEGERRAVLGEIVGRLDGEQDLDAWVGGAPLVEVEFAG